MRFNNSLLITAIVTGVAFFSEKISAAMELTYENKITEPVTFKYSSNSHCWDRKDLPSTETLDPSKSSVPYKTKPDESGSTSCITQKPLSQLELKVTIGTTTGTCKFDVKETCYALEGKTCKVAGYKVKSTGTCGATDTSGTSKIKVEAD